MRSILRNAARVTNEIVMDSIKKLFITAILVGLVIAVATSSLIIAVQNNIK